MFDKISNFLEYDFKVKYFLYAYGAYIGLNIAWKILKMILTSIQNSIQKGRVSRFIDERNKALKKFEIPVPKLSQEVIEQVLNNDITSLKKMLEQKVVTSEDLVNIFSKRCQEYGVQYGILTHLKYDEAIQQAKICDKLRKENSADCKKLLFGIPISIKETIEEKGYPSTIGSIYRINHSPKEDGYSVKLLKDSGAIPFLRTNIPLGAMLFESCNNVYGRVLNPWDKTKYAGGSSGGEGAAVAARMSPGGLGSDIGGSIRIPAAMCGVYGFKPTAQRSVLAGHTHFSDAFAGQRTVLCATGPLGKSVDDMILFFKALSDPYLMKVEKLAEKDTFFPYQQIDDNILNNKKSKRRFGYFKTTHAFDATLCMQRGVDIAVQKLKDEGHHLIEITIPNTEELHDSFLQFLMADNYQQVYDSIGKDTVKEYLPFDALSTLSDNTKKVLSILLRLLVDKSFARTLLNTFPISVHQLNIFHNQINKIQKSVLQIFDDTEIEAIICPAFGAPAMPHSSSGDVSSVAFYTFMWNVLNFPCGVLPVTKVLKEEQHFNNARHKGIVAKMVDKHMQNSENLPVGVQVVAPPFKEETCLNVMKIIDEKVQFYKHNQYPVLS